MLHHTQVIPRKAIQEVTGLHFQTVHQLSNHPDFPKPIKQIGRTLYYPLEPVFQYLLSIDKIHHNDAPALMEYAILIDDATLIDGGLV